MCCRVVRCGGSDEAKSEPIGPVSPCSSPRVAVISLPRDPTKCALVEIALRWAAGKTTIVTSITIRQPLNDWDSRANARES